MHAKLIYKSYSGHDGNPKAVNVQFSSDDGTSANLVLSTSILASLELGKEYIVSITPGAASIETVQADEAVQDTQGADLETAAKEMEGYDHA